MKLPLSLCDRNIFLLKNYAGLRRSIQLLKIDTFTHFPQEMLCDILFHCHNIFLFFFAPGLVDLINQLALIGKKEKAFGILIKPSDWVNALGIMDILYDIFSSILLSCRANHSARLVISKEDLFRLLPLLSLSGNALSVQFYFFFSADFLSKTCLFSIYLNFPFGN